jgi:hypothetical protein
MRITGVRYRTDRPFGSEAVPHVLAFSAQQNKFTCHEHFIDTIDSTERVVAYGPDGNISEVVYVGVEIE